MGLFHWLKHEAHKIGHDVKKIARRTKKEAHKIGHHLAHDAKRIEDGAKKVVSEAEKEGKKILKYAEKHHIFKKIEQKIYGEAKELYKKGRQEYSEVKKELAEQKKLIEQAEKGAFGAAGGLENVFKDLTKNPYLLIGTIVVGGIVISKVMK